MVTSRRGENVKTQVKWVTLSLTNLIQCLDRIRREGQYCGTDGKQQLQYTVTVRWVTENAMEFMSKLGWQWGMYYCVGLVTT